MQKHASEMKIVTFADLYCCFITFYCSILFYFIPCHVLSIMMFKCTLMKEQINLLKSKSMLSDSSFPKVITLSCFHCINKMEKLKKIDKLLIAVSRKQMSVSRKQNSFLNVLHYLKHTHFKLLNSFLDNFIEMLW